MLQRASREPTPPPAIACRNRYSPADFCIRRIVLHSFIPPASSMAQHAACARMNSEIGQCGRTRAQLPQRPLACAISLMPVLVCRGSALLHGRLRAWEKRVDRKTQMRADAAARRASTVRMSRPGRCACFYVYVMCTDASSKSSCSFVCPLSRTTIVVVSDERTAAKYYNVNERGPNETIVQI